MDDEKLEISTTLRLKMLADLSKEIDKDLEDHSMAMGFNGELPFASNIYESRTAVSELNNYLRAKNYGDNERQDLWNMDKTLAHIILWYMKRYKDLYESSSFRGVIYSKNGNPNSEEWNDEIHTNDSEWAVDEIIWTFQTIANGDASDEYEVKAMWDEEYAKHENKPRESWFEEIEGSTNRRWNSPMWKDDPEGEKRWLDKMKEIQERINRGLEIFAQVFQKLWD